MRLRPNNERRRKGVSSMSVTEGAKVRKEFLDEACSQPCQMHQGQRNLRKSHWPCRE